MGEVKAEEEPEEVRQTDGAQRSYNPSCPSAPAARCVPARWMPSCPAA